jgi:hypothetical protein
MELRNKVFLSFEKLRKFDTIWSYKNAENISNKIGRAQVPIKSKLMLMA